MKNVIKSILVVILVTSIGTVGLGAVGLAIGLVLEQFMVLPEVFCAVVAVLFAGGFLSAISTAFMLHALTK